MSVGHSRRTSRKPSPHHCGSVGEQLLQLALDSLLLERRAARRARARCRRAPPDVRSPGAPPCAACARPGVRGAPSAPPVLLLDDRRRGHPVQRLDVRAAAVGPDHERAVGLEHQQPHGLGQNRGETADVGDLSSGRRSGASRERNDRPGPHAATAARTGGRAPREARRGRSGPPRASATRRAAPRGWRERGPSGPAGESPPEASAAAAVRAPRGRRRSPRGTPAPPCPAHARARGGVWGRARSARSPPRNSRCTGFSIPTSLTLAPMPAPRRACAQSGRAGPDARAHGGHPRTSPSPSLPFLGVEQAHPCSPAAHTRRHAEPEPFWPAQADDAGGDRAAADAAQRLTVGPVVADPEPRGACCWSGCSSRRPSQLEYEHPRRRRAALGLTRS